MDWKKTVNTALLLTLCGCIPTQAQRQAEFMRQQSAKIRVDMQQCAEAAETQPRYADIVPHLITIDHPQPTIEQLSDNTKPSKDETNLLKTYHDEKLPCREQAFHSLQSIAPMLASDLSAIWAASDQIYLSLVQRQITWGEYTQRMQQVILAGQQQILSHSQQMDAELNTAHQAELVQRQAGIAVMTNAVSNYAAQQQADTNALNAMSYQNRVNHTSCNTRYVAGAYQTNCF